jgi:hypothetical protein
MDGQIQIRPSVNDMYSERSFTTITCAELKVVVEHRVRENRRTKNDKIAPEMA